MTRRSRAVFVLSLTFLLPNVTARADPAPAVATRRLPAGGVQPEAAVDAKGVVHLIYLAGDPKQSDVYYQRSTDAGGAAFAAPVRVNAHAGSAIAIGTVRGAHLALGRDGRVHVAWMGSGLAEPKAPGDAAPMLYTRLGDDGRFEPERNVITERVGLDGGGSVAADDRGNVYVAWHAPTRPGAGEAGRRVWVARSTDDGRTFAPEALASDPAAGACGCCGLGIFANDDGRVFALYRSAAQAIHRDVHLLRLDAASMQSADVKLSPWQTSACPMSTAVFAKGAQTLLAAWESQDQVEWGTIDPTTGRVIATHPLPGRPNRRKHPAIAVNRQGQVLVAWTEGTGWAKGGSVVWQVFDEQGNPVAGAAGRADDLPMWDKPAAFAKSDGSFVVVY